MLANAVTRGTLSVTGKGRIDPRCARADDTEAEM